MFSSKKDSTGVKMAKLATLVAHNVHISGDLEFSEGLRMDGQVTGNVSGRPGEETLLVVSDQGAIRGNVSAYDVIINGCVTGDVTVAHFVELQSNARVLGNIYYQQLRMDIGATVEGKLTKLDSQSAHVPTLPSPTEYAVDFSTT
ncbi:MULTISPECIES: polymer-forming cytoskeletal protein [Caballeronia]|jgi:cytoskeletal protein CcmA (bactofilin family)|uniref:Polymer-forming cytoskeletal protein n=3 Tax=Caballeronia TaxID=1827195 RepID=A0ACB5QXQ6_9BURK|nr:MULTISPECIES: polymer-forming cytoskeletal protein [Caballeronia]MBC8639123.1 polymer-forming cytoskeletal protein [Caballeronia sp. EK]GJH11014.1 polymer-forming cytoskeletal protein [Caballeronia novacaledonica]GJH19477.1 polymer-forming cytoskeletal protein [Caballeronia novacaledonica]GJH29501.1 polymer-forming cytoskeletal protein [Caballeronia novacaledonica]